VTLGPGVTDRLVMNEADALECFARRSGRYHRVGTVGAAMFVGSLIALLQGITQIQEVDTDLRSQDRRLFMLSPSAHPLSEVKFIRLLNWFIRGIEKGF